MKADKKYTWQNAPVNLSHEEIENPYLVLKNFYSRVRLPVIRKLLHTFLLAGIEDQHKWEQEEVVELIYSFENLGKLMEALWLLNEAGVTCTEEESKLRELPDKFEVVWSPIVIDALEWFDYDESDFYTNKLNKDEEINPFIVIRELFQWKELDAIKSDLLFWRHTALTNPWEYTAMDKEEMAGLYKRVDKVVEAAFVLTEILYLKENSQTK